MDNKKIASLLDISEKTVAFHLTSIFEKLGVKSRLEAAIWAKDHLSDDLEEFPG
jgi:DNA-binding NarL/FixJ family response regulator